MQGQHERWGSRQAEKRGLVGVRGAGVTKQRGMRVMARRGEEKWRRGPGIPLEVEIQ